MIKIPDGFNEIYKTGNYIKRTYLYFSPPPKFDIIMINSVNLKTNGNHGNLTGYVYSMKRVARLRTMYYTKEENIRDDVISYDVALASIL